MSTAQDRVKSLREKFLRKELYVIITTNVAPKEKIEELLLAHLEHQIRLEKSGIMFGAGRKVLRRSQGHRGRGSFSPGEAQDVHGREVEPE